MRAAGLGCRRRAAPAGRRPPRPSRRRSRRACGRNSSGLRVAALLPAAANSDRIGLAEDDGAGEARHADAGRVPRRPVALEDRRVVGRRHVGGVDHVLHAEGQPVQRALDGMLVEFPCGGDRLGLVEMEPGLDLRVRAPRSGRCRSGSGSRWSACRRESARRPRRQSENRVPWASCFLRQGEDAGALFAPCR